MMLGLQFSGGDITWALLVDTTHELSGSVHILSVWPHTKFTYIK